MSSMLFTTDIVDVMHMSAPGYRSFSANSNGSFGSASFADMSASAAAILPPPASAGTIATHAQPATSGTTAATVGPSAASSIEISGLAAPEKTVAEDKSHGKSAAPQTAATSSAIGNGERQSGDRRISASGTATDDEHETARDRDKSTRSYRSPRSDRRKRHGDDRHSDEDDETEMQETGDGDHRDHHGHDDHTQQDDRNRHRDSHRSGNARSTTSRERHRSIHTTDDRRRPEDEHRSDDRRRSDRRPVENGNDKHSDTGSVHSGHLSDDGEDRDRERDKDKHRSDKHHRVRRESERYDREGDDVSDGERSEGERLSEIGSGDIESEDRKKRRLKRQERERQLRKQNEQAELKARDMLVTMQLHQLIDDGVKFPESFDVEKADLSEKEKQLVRARYREDSKESVHSGEDLIKFIASTASMAFSMYGLPKDAPEQLKAMVNQNAFRDDLRRHCRRAQTGPIMDPVTSMITRGVQPFMEQIMASIATPAIGAAAKYVHGSKASTGQTTIEEVQSTSNPSTAHLQPSKPPLMQVALPSRAPNGYHETTQVAIPLPQKPAANGTGIVQLRGHVREPHANLMSSRGSGAATRSSVAVMAGSQAGFSHAHGVHKYAPAPSSPAMTQASAQSLATTQTSTPIANAPSSKVNIRSDGYVMSAAEQREFEDFKRSKREFARAQQLDAERLRQRSSLVRTASDGRLNGRDHASPAVPSVASRHQGQSHASSQVVSLPRPSTTRPAYAPLSGADHVHAHTHAAKSSSLSASSASHVPFRPRDAHVFSTEIGPESRLSAASTSSTKAAQPHITLPAHSAMHVSMEHTKRAASPMSRPQADSSLIDSALSGHRTSSIEHGSLRTTSPAITPQAIRVPAPATTPQTASVATPATPRPPTTPRASATTTPRASATTTPRASVHSLARQKSAHIDFVGQATPFNTHATKSDITATTQTVALKPSVPNGAQTATDAKAALSDFAKALTSTEISHVKESRVSSGATGQLSEEDCKYLFPDLKGASFDEEEDGEGDPIDLDDGDDEGAPLSGPPPLKLDTVQALEIGIPDLREMMQVQAEREKRQKRLERIRRDPSKADF